MTDKDIKDYCKNCDVEPPAMRFKCPECEHNPDKEQIIIDGVNIIGTIDEWARLVAHEAEIVKNYILDINKQLARKTQELEVICKAFDIEYAYDDDGKIYGRSNKLRSLEQECEELKGKYKNVLDLAKQNADANEYCLQELEQENYRYRKALEEIEDFRKKHCDFWCEGNRIPDIINKAKEEK